MLLCSFLTLSSQGCWTVKYSLFWSLLKGPCPQQCCLQPLMPFGIKNSGKTCELFPPYNLLRINLVHLVVAWISCHIIHWEFEVIPSPGIAQRDPTLRPNDSIPQAKNKTLWPIKGQKRPQNQAKIESKTRQKL